MRDREAYQAQRRPPPGRPMGGPGRPPGLPGGYLQRGYFDSKDNVWPEVIQQWPQEIARTFKVCRPGLTYTQARRFFNLGRSLEQRVEAQGFERLRGDILALKSLAANSVGRKAAPELLKQFIETNINTVTDSPNPGDAFARGFMKHFESVMAYLKYYETKGQGGNT